MIRVVLLDGTCQRIPYLRTTVTTDITTDHPDNVRFILIALAQELTIGSGFLHIHPAQLRTPDTVHGDIDTVAGSHIDDIIHVFPIAIDTFLRHF